ncbi:RICIN domain-containing protein [Kitasatospora sp. NPDC053057]|uniref:RICIN domain-containing protein n=1 Tax=Kitasatospora sp. NPDC053057 TaxID=3364062 RepID=UPI0037C5EF8F
MPHSGTATIPEADSADRIPGRPQPDEPTITQPARHHREAVSAYARTCCADSRAAQELANDAWQRAAKAGGSTGDPAPGRLRLLAEVTRTAAEWADTGRGPELSPAFTAWLTRLPRPDDADAPEGAGSADASASSGGADASARAALAAAEADSLILAAFESLPAARQEDLWRHLDDTTGSPAPHTDSPAGRRLQDACLQAYASRAPQRSCRHLAARLGDHVRHAGGGEAGELDRHLAGCASCRSLRADLDAIRTWQRPALLRALVLWEAAPSPSPSPSPSAAALAPEQQPPDQPSGSESDGAAPVAHDRSRRLRRPARTDGRTGRRLLIPLASATAGALAALAIAGLLLSTVEGAGEHPLPVDAPTLSATVRTLPAQGFDGESPEIGSAAMATASPTASPSAAAPTGTPAPAAQPAAATSVDTSPSPTPPIAAGLPLVNHSSGLCIGLATSTQAAGPVQLQLQQCNGQAAQHWQRLPAGQDSYQLRNTATGTCLDGTTAGGNNVTVTLQTCRSDAGRAEQLWRFAPDAQEGTFRLMFVPRVPASDYSAHLLGPQDWPKADPPRPGSLLVHLPDYYNSDSFVFTMG